MCDLNVKLKRLSPDGTIPTRGSEYSAGFDLYASHDYLLQPGETALINTGFGMQLPAGYFGAIFARSGLSTKYGVRPANCVGVVDCDYSGEVMVPLHNDSDKPYDIGQCERVAQMVLLPYHNVHFEEVDELDLTGRGSGGFGSTGK